MTKEKSEDMEYIKTTLNDEQLKSFRIQLESAELIKDKNDLNQKIMEEKIEKKIAEKSSIEALKEMEETLKNGGKETEFGVFKKLNDSEKEELELTIEAQKEFIKLDIPMRTARIELRQFIESRNKINSTEMQIAKIKKAIKNKYVEEYVPKKNKNTYTN